MRIGTVYPDSEAYRDPSIQPYFFCCPGRSISWHHRCIALLYLIPMGNFNCVICSTHQISSSRRDIISVARKKIHSQSRRDVITFQGFLNFPLSLNSLYHVPTGLFEIIITCISTNNSKFTIHEVNRFIKYLSWIGQKQLAFQALF